MYFKEKEDTNIDSEFAKKRHIGSIIKDFDLKKLSLKKILIIVGVILALIIMIIIFATSGKKSNYTIELLGGESIIINLGDEFIDPGYKAYDKKGNDVTDELEIISTVDISKVGEYEILYMISNVDIVRYVQVLEAVDETGFNLFGQKTIDLEVGEKYVEPGYIVLDGDGTDLTDKVQISSNLNNKKVGTYQITYSVVNNKNITITKKRIINIIEKK